MSKSITSDAEKIRLVSDYHKDFYGYRPPADLTDEQRIALWDRIAVEHDRLMATKEGRDLLRSRHWVVDEPPNSAAA